MRIQQCRAAAVAIGCVAVALFCATPARAGLINPTSTVDIFFDYVNNGVATVAPSQPFNAGPAPPPPWSLAAPIPPPTPLPITGYTAPNAPSPIHTTEPFNLTADTGFFFTDSQVIVYNNASPPLPFCFSSGNAGSSCADPYDKFDFKFTNENIKGVSVASNSSSDFAPATFTYTGVTPPIEHLGLQLVSPNEFTVDVTGDNPAYLSTLIIDVSFASTPTTPIPAALPLFATGLGALGLFGWRKKRKNAATLAAA